MHLAGRHEFHQILDLLVRQSADPLIEDNDGHKAIDLVPEEEIVIRQTLKAAMQVSHLVSLVGRLQVAIIARSSREMSQTVRIDRHSFLSRVRISVRPRIFVIHFKKSRKLSRRASVDLNEPVSC